MKSADVDPHMISNKHAQVIQWKKLSFEPMIEYWKQDVDKGNKFWPLPCLYFDPLELI